MRFKSFRQIHRENLKTAMSRWPKKSARKFHYCFYSPAKRRYFYFDSERDLRTLDRDVIMAVRSPAERRTAPPL